VTHIALLRAVNLGAHNKIGMGDLRAFFVDIGFADARTLLQSGNVLFSGGAKSTDQLEEMLERAAAKQLGLDTDFFVRTAREWRDVIKANPFPKEAVDDPSHLLATIVKQPIDAKGVAALQKAIVGRERVSGKGRCLYAVYPDGVGRSRLTPAMMEKHLGKNRGTARNWNTVVKLGALVGV
jgi:uncharacterized protein (DUF1697 family)